MNDILKPIIVIAAYGSGDVTAQQNLERIDAQVREHFPGYEVRWALTARWLLKRLNAAGQTTLFTRQEPLQNLADLYAELRAAGKTNVAVLCLLVHESSESTRLFETPAEGLHVEYGQPLLEDPLNIDGLIQAEASQFGSAGDLTIVIGHGMDDSATNAPFVRMDENLRANYRDVYVTMIHGSPSPEEVFPAVSRSDHKRVVFVPLMITNGEHITYDVLGDHDGSWISKLRLPYKLGPSLSEMPAVMEVYFKGLERVLARF